MTFGEKLTKLRKENNVTQEQLAGTLGVSRQSVSKWESDLAYPETDKLIRIGELFNRSLDYLLKKGTDQKEADKAEAASGGITDDHRRDVTMAEALDFLEVKKKNTIPTAIATFLCILSPVCLLLLAVLSESGKNGVSEALAVGLGLMALFGFVTVAVIIFMITGMQTKKYDFLEKEVFGISPDAENMVRERREAFHRKYNAGNVIGTALCLLSLIPLFLGIILFENNDFMIVVTLCIMLAVIGIGVMCFIMVGMPWASYEKLLQQGEYSPEKKANSGAQGWISLVYWLVATAVYLGWSFLTDDWGRSWMVWPIAGVLFPAVLAIAKVLHKPKDI